MIAFSHPRVVGPDSRKKSARTHTPRFSNKIQSKVCRLQSNLHFLFPQCQHTAKLKADDSSSCGMVRLVFVAKSNIFGSFYKSPILMDQKWLRNSRITPQINRVRTQARSVTFALRKDSRPPTQPPTTSKTPNVINIFTAKKHKSRSNSRRRASPTTSRGNQQALRLDCWIEQLFRSVCARKFPIAECKLVNLQFAVNVLTHLQSLSAKARVVNDKCSLFVVTRWLQFRK